MNTKEMKSDLLADPVRTTGAADLMRPFLQELAQILGKVLYCRECRQSGTQAEQSKDRDPTG